MLRKINNRAIARKEYEMTKYIAKVGNKKKQKEGKFHTHWSEPCDTRKEARQWAEKVIDATKKQRELGNTLMDYDTFTIEEVEVNFTDNEEVAKREGYKPFWLNVYESNKHVKLFFAKDKESLETDMASEMIQEDWSENAYGEDSGWFWKNGQSDWEIFEEKGDIL